MPGKVGRPKNSQTATCDKCGKQFQEDNWKMANRQFHYCSRACYIAAIQGQPPRMWLNPEATREAQSEGQTKRYEKERLGGTGNLDTW